MPMFSYYHLNSLDIFIWASAFNLSQDLNFERVVYLKTKEKKKWGATLRDIHGGIKKISNQTYNCQSFFVGVNAAKVQKPIGLYVSLIQKKIIECIE